MRFYLFFYFFLDRRLITTTFINISIFIKFTSGGSQAAKAIDFLRPKTSRKLNLQKADNLAVLSRKAMT